MLCGHGTRPNRHWPAASGCRMMPAPNARLQILHATPRNDPRRKPCPRSRTTADSSPPSPARSPRRTPIDEPALRKHASWLATQPGVVAVMTNGHTGEVFSLTPRERAEVTRIVADELRGKLPVISSIVCEGLPTPRSMRKMASEAGAKAPRRDAAAPLAALRLPPGARGRLLRCDRRGRPRPRRACLSGVDPRLVLVGHAGAACEAARTCRHSRSASAT